MENDPRKILHMGSTIRNFDFWKIHKTQSKRNHLRVVGAPGVLKSDPACIFIIIDMVEHIF